MPAPIAYGIAVAAVALANWACGDSRPTDTTPQKPKPDSGEPPVRPDVGAGFPRPDAGLPAEAGLMDSFIPDARPGPDIRDVYIPPDTGLMDIGFTDFGLDAGTSDLGIMDAGRPPCNPTNLEAFDGYDDNCNGNNNALGGMKKINIEPEIDGVSGGSMNLALGDFFGDSLGDIAVAHYSAGAVWMIKGTSFTLQEGITFHLVWNQNRFGVDATPRGGARAALPNSSWIGIHRSYSGDPTGLGTALAVVRVRDQQLGAYRNELWIGAGALNNAWWPSGDGLESGGILRFDAFQSTMHEYVADHADLLNPIYLRNNHMWLIKGEDRIPTPMMNARPGSQLGSEIIRAGDVNGFSNGADEVVLPYFQHPRAAIVSALAVTQPSQRIQTIVDLLNQQGYLIEGGLNFGNTDEAVWAFADIDEDLRNDLFLGIEGDTIRDQGAGKLRIVANLNLLPTYPQPFDPTEDSTFPQNMWRLTLTGIPGNGTTRYGSDLGVSLAVGRAFADPYLRVAVGATTDNTMYTFRGDLIRQQSSGARLMVNGPMLGGQAYVGDPREFFTSGGISNVDPDGDGLGDFVAGTILRGHNGTAVANGGLDLICGNGRMGNGRTMSSTVTQGSVTSLACERMYGPTGARIGRINQNAVYDLNNDGADEVGTCDKQARCFVLLGGR